MPTEVRIDRTGELITVSLTGPLTLDGVARVRGILLKCLADCPTAMIVDLTGLTVDSDLPLTVFAAVARHARAWPGVAPMLLCARPGPVADRFARWRLGRFLPIHAGPEQAAAALDAPAEALPAIRVELPYGPEAQPEARRLVGDACLVWELPHLREPAELIAVELAGNAVRHGAPPVGLVAAARTTYLHIVARDASSEQPRTVDPGVPDRMSTAGQGLRLVDAVATAWGCLRTAGGKAVWATLRWEPVGWPRLGFRTPPLARAT